MPRKRIASLLGAALFAAPALHAQTLDPATIAGFHWRTVGPANFKGRLSDVVGIPGPVQDALRRRGGRRHLEDDEQRRHVAPGVRRQARSSRWACSPSRRSDTQQVWAGTGEPNSRNTIEPGRGRLQVDRRRHHVEARWASRRRSTSGASSSHPTQPEHRLRRRARRGVEVEPRARPLQDRPTAARRGSSSSSSATGRASSTSRSTRRIPNVIYASS